MTNLKQLRAWQLKLLVFFALLVLLGGVTYVVLEFIFGQTEWFLKFQAFLLVDGWMILALPAGVLGMVLTFWKLSKIFARPGQ